MSTLQKTSIQNLIVDKPDISNMHLLFLTSLQNQFYVNFQLDNVCFNYLGFKFPDLLEEKLKERVFVGSDITNYI